LRRNLHGTIFKKYGNELLSYVNDSVLKKFQDEYGENIFAPLQIKNPITLK
jgi:hypothetical protein